MTSRQVTVGVLLWGLVIVLTVLFIIITEQESEYDTPDGIKPTTTTIVTVTVHPEDLGRDRFGEGT